MPKPSNELSATERTSRRAKEVNPTFRISFCAGGLFAVMIGLWLTQLWQAEKQVRLHSEQFVRQLEKRNWSAAGAFIANDYHDDWDHDRRAILNRLQIGLRCFSSLTINQANPQVSENSPIGWWSAKVTLQGSGTDFAPEIISRVNRLTEPFVLHWRRESWRPWDWKLVRVSNPALKISDRDF